MERVLRGMIRRPGWVVALALSLTVLALSRLVDFRTGRPLLLLDPSINSMLPEGDEGREFYDYVRRLFGSDETLLVAVVDDDLFTFDNLHRVRRMSDRIRKIDGVHHVVSLANALNIRSVGGDLQIEPFIEEIPEDPDALAEIRRQAFESEIYGGNLVSRDGRVAAILVYFLDMPEQEFLARGIDEQIGRVTEEERGDAEVWISGVAHIKAETGRLLRADLMLTVPVAVALMAAVALVSFRTVRGVVVPISSVAISLVWILGVIAATNGFLNVVTVAAPPILIVVGFAYAVHVVSAYYDELRSGGEGAQADDGVVFRALRHVWLPVLLTGVTTASGFLSLMTSPIAAVRQFGLFSGIGVALTMAVSLTFAPALLQLLPAPRRLRARGRDGRINALLEGLGRFDVRHRRPILWAGAAVAGLSLVGMTKIEISTDLVRNFREDNPARRHFEAINEHLEGSNTFYVILETDYRDAFREPVNLREIERLQEWLERQPEIGGTTSLVDYLKAIDQGFHDNDRSQSVIPDSKRLITQLLFFGANDELENFVDSRYQTVSLLVRTSAVDSGDVAALVRRVEEHLESLPAHLKSTVSGNAVLVSKTIDDIALGQALSLSVAFVIIFAILALLFTSLRVGFLALLPNALPVLVYFGVLGFSGVTLNTTTGLVACLVIGIAVDDTIHFLVRFNTVSKRTADETKGVVEALRTVGRPVSYTTAALCLGFLTLGLSNLRNQVEFGILASFTLAVAWLIDVSFTPALAARMRIVTLWDVLTLNLGEDPQRSIPLFAGLKKTQARIAALMASIHTFAKGHRLFQVGDEGEEMYVVIDGQLRASVATERGVVQFGILERGDVVGEVALFHGRRTADVEALSDVRLLRLTHRSLERIRRRYPRIGAQLYHNLSEILADRVATTTAKVR